MKVCLPGQEQPPQRGCGAVARTIPNNQYSQETGE